LPIRTLHTYVGMLIAPTVIFFASTGMLQIYSLHEAHGSYTPAPLIEKLAATHKDQRFSLGRTHGGEKPSAKRAESAAADAGARRPRLATLLLKLFFTAVAIGLIFSTLLGVWMALQQRLKRRVYIVLLLIGSLAPVVLAALTA
jgi:hypothetical protein